MDHRLRPDTAESADAARLGSERSIAVAIKRDAVDQDGGALERPRVIAKGEGAIAEQILAIAFDRDIKVRSDADLAEILSVVEVDSEIPLEALAAVAEILTYVYRATQPPDPATGQAAGTKPSDSPLHPEAERPESPT